MVVPRILWSAEEHGDVLAITMRWLCRSFPIVLCDIGKQYQAKQSHRGQPVIFGEEPTALRRHMPDQTFVVSPE